MSSNRIQKLLFSEYNTFEDVVLIESPFAQTTREGVGIRQMIMGLTPTNLILAADVFIHHSCPTHTYSNVDPDTETLELIYLCPIDAVRISIFRRKSRHTLKAHFSNDRTMYFELAAPDKRQMLWNLWCERIKFLSPEIPKSIQSETSVGSSTSASTFMTHDLNKKGIMGVWDYQNDCKLKSKSSRKKLHWTDKNLYIGTNFVSKAFPIFLSTMTSPSKSQSKSKSSSGKRTSAATISFSLRSKSTSGIPSNTGNKVIGPINRFGSGVSDNCRNLLYLPGHGGRYSHFYDSPLSEQTNECDDMMEFPTCGCEPWKLSKEFIKLMDDALSVWERQGNKAKHLRRYGIAPLPHFLNGLGPWNLSRPQSGSMMVRRVSSEVNLSRRSEFKLDYDKRQLSRYSSCESLIYNGFDNRTLEQTSKKNEIVFWTTDLWYRPIDPKVDFKLIQKHLNSLKLMVANAGKASYSKSNESAQQVDSKSSHYYSTHSSNKKCVFCNTLEENPLNELKLDLRLSVNLCAWDFDSTSLAYQLTIIERDLFLKITSRELISLVQNHHSKNAFNITAVIAFSYRISNLVATEIVDTSILKMRARLIARFINVVEKLHKLHNMQTAKSVLLGLQSPAVYRLKSTWAYVRKHHSTKYHRLQFLIKANCDPRTKSYQKLFRLSTRTPPYIPSLFYIIASLLGHLCPIEDIQSNIRLGELPTFCSGLSYEDLMHLSSHKKLPTVAKRIYASIFPWEEPPEDDITGDNDIPDSDIDDDIRELTKGLYSNEQINSVIRLATVAKHLEKWQKAASQYAFVNTKLVQEYLFKARYKEEHENFVLSKGLEPTNQTSRHLKSYFSK